MDIGLILTIFFGVIGLFGIFLGWKAWNRPKISMIIENTTILADLTHASSDISVNYMGKNVSNNLILFSAYLINTGNSDIDSRDVEKPITVYLPKDSKWLSCSIIKNKHDMKVTEKYDNEQLEVNVGLWKKKEGFKIDALISVGDKDVSIDKKEILNYFDIKSRIKGLDRVNILSLPEQKNIKNKKTIYFKSYILPIITLLIYVLPGVALYTGFPLNNKFDFKVYRDNQLVSLNVENGKPKLIDSVKEINPNEKGYYLLNVKVEKRGVKRIDKILGIISMLMGPIVFALIIFDDVKLYILKRKVEYN